MKNILIIIGAVVLLLVGGVWWSNSLKSKQTAVEIEGIKQYTRTERDHVAEVVAYEENPPVGGKHAQVWAACNGNVYKEPIAKEQAVHSLEHGAVWITYQPSLTPDQIAALEKKVRGYTLMSPLAEQGAPVILTAWNNQLLLQSADDPRVDQFLAKFRQGPQTPEPGATCNAVPGGMQG